VCHAWSVGSANLDLVRSIFAALVVCADNSLVMSPIRQLTAPLMLAALLLGFAPAPAAQAPRARAASLPFDVELRVSANAKAGSVNLLTVAASAPATTSCTLQISAQHLAKTLPSSRLGSVVWRWRAPARAPKGVWTFTATCREGASSVASWYKEAEMGFPERSGALLGAPAKGAPTASGASCDSQGVCFANDPLPVGQCTWYAVGRRPDLLGIVHGDAREWLRAARGRVPEGRRPAVGALAVLVPHSPGGPGHVAYVAAVSHGRVLLDDSDWRPTSWSPWLEVHEHWEAARSASGYIYGGPAGSGP
jgi:surface antigen